MTDQHNIVDVKDFHPKTGAYWQGYGDALDGKPKMPPARYNDRAIAHYNNGYTQGLVPVELEQ